MSDEDNFSTMLYLLYKAWCDENNLDHTDKNTMEIFIDKYMPIEGKAK